MIDNTLTYEHGVALWQRWAAMWNGDTALAHAIIADGVHLNLTRDARAFFDPAGLRDGASVAAWVAKIRGARRTLAYTTVGGPFVDVERGAVSSPWIADIVDAEGRALRKLGVDALIVRDGRIAEAWTVSAET